LIIMRQGQVVGRFQAANVSESEVAHLISKGLPESGLQRAANPL
jgi:hypothetical protein